jgi:hypothetical protein
MLSTFETKRQRRALTFAENTMRLFMYVILLRVLAHGAKMMKNLKLSTIARRLSTWFGG